MAFIRSHFAQRLRSSSLSTVPPPQASSDYSNPLAKVANSILYLSPLPSEAGHPIYVLNSAAFPDSEDVDHDALLPYMLEILPSEEGLISGKQYEVVFFAGEDAGATSVRRNRPGWAWSIRVYNALSRATRKRLRKLYIVHERSWIRILLDMFSTIISPKFRKKIVHVSTLSGLAMHTALENLLVPVSAYLHDQRLVPDLYAPEVSRERAFGVREPLPISSSGQRRLPRVLRETTKFILMEENAKTEGLFRVSSHSRMVNVLREAYGRGQKYIIWREGALFLPMPASQFMSRTAIQQLPPREVYGIHEAAGLIKVWYRELRDPVFGQSCYAELRTRCPAAEDAYTLGALVDLLSPTSPGSPLSATVRDVITRHLLPLLSEIASFEEDNKMSAANLAICFAPALLRGPDPLEDAKIFSVIRRVLQAAITAWPSGLREACGITPEDFQRDLEDPASLEYEDPPEDDRQREPRIDSAVQVQPHTILLVESESSGDDEKPPLPRRPPSSRPGAILDGQAENNQLWPDRAVLHSLTSFEYSTTPYRTDVLAESPTSYSPVTDYTSKFSGWSIENENHEESQSARLFRHVSIPKRKALTQQQISNAELAGVHPPLRSRSDSSAAPLGVATMAGLKRKPVECSEDPTAVSANPEDVSIHSPDLKLRMDKSNSGPVPERLNFVKTFPLTSQRHTSGPVTLPSMQSSRAHATSLPVPNAPPYIPRIRAPSPNLLPLLTTFEPSLVTSFSVEANQRLTPGRLDLGKRSVDDLRRLYEERVATVEALPPR